MNMTTTERVNVIKESLHLALDFDNTVSGGVVTYRGPIPYLTLTVTAFADIILTVNVPFSEKLDVARYADILNRSFAEICDMVVELV